MSRPRLMIPGPIEFTDEVMAEMARPTPSHVDSAFIETFGQALEDLRSVFLAGPDYQPFILAGSGTLAMDSAVTNLVEPGDRALVVDTGYFSQRMADILRRYGAQVDALSAAPGETISAEQLKQHLADNDAYDVVAITHVDTSTGVLTDARGLTAASKEAGALVILDGVCAAAAEEMRQVDWGVDVYLTASQKAIGTPPGLALLTASPAALAKWRGRTHPVGSYYSDWGYWLPIMQAYEARKVGYFGTPAVNLVMALGVSLRQILDEGMDQAFARHVRLSNAVKAGIAAMGMTQLPTDISHAAHTLTCPCYPEGIDASFLRFVREEGAILAGGLHPAVKSKYFRIGHMGATSRADVLTAIGAVETGLRRAGYAVEPGIGLAAAQAELD